MTDIETVLKHMIPDHLPTDFMLSPRVERNLEQNKAIVRQSVHDYRNGDTDGCPFAEGDYCFLSELPCVLDQELYDHPQVDSPDQCMFMAGARLSLIDGFYPEPQHYPFRREVGTGRGRVAVFRRHHAAKLETEQKVLAGGWAFNG